MSWSSDDDAKLLRAFLAWYVQQPTGGTDAEIVARFMAEHESKSQSVIVR